MIKYEYGDINSDLVLIQPVDEYDLEGIENEINIISKNINKSFHLIALKVDDWNNDLSPWKAPAVFGKEGFGDKAKETLDKILKLCSDNNKTYYIGGYSLAGLFALWASYQTDKFKGVAAASPSMWFLNFIDYMKDNEIKTKKVYLSLGDKEEKAKNPIMATVGNKIREAYNILNEKGIKTTLEWNEGNHFRDADIRTAKAFSWVINTSI